MAELAAEAARLLRMREKDILSLRLLRRSVDAREEVRLVYTVEVAVKEESAILRRARSRKISRAAQAPAYTPPSPLSAPAGLFAALVLAQAGLRPILLERGRPVERRKADVERFWATGELDLTSNVQFGEGGAGAFSDGKLNTGTRDPRHRFILETLLSCGAPEDILIDAKPHVGTDYLHTVLVNLRRRLLELGTDIRFESRLADLDIRDGALRGITAEGPEGVYTLPCSHLLLCPGHSARDTFAMLHKRGVPMEAKPFAVGVRIEHRQADCDAAQYRQYAGHPGLPVSTYKLSCHLPGGRAAYSFCVCPGGEVVAAASEAERVVTNGMSEFARDKENINGGLLVRSPGGYRLPAEAGVCSLRSGGWGLPGPGPAGGGLSGGAPLRRPRPSAPQLPPRRHLDGPAPVPAALRGGYHCRGAPPAGAEAPGLRRSGRRPDGGGEPFLLPSAHPTGWDLPVLSPGPVPLRRGSRLCRRHPLRRRGWDALCRATLSIHSKGV